VPPFIATALISLLPALGEPSTPAPPTAVRMRFSWLEPLNITKEGSKSSATIFCISVPEGGGTGGPIAITITANGKDSELTLKRIIARLAEKPVR